MSDDDWYHAWGQALATAMTEDNLDVQAMIDTLMVAKHHRGRYLVDTIHVLMHRRDRATKTHMAQLRDFATRRTIDLASLMPQSIFSCCSDPEWLFLAEHFVVSSDIVPKITLSQFCDNIHLFMDYPRKWYTFTYNRPIISPNIRRDMQNRNDQVCQRVENAQQLCIAERLMAAALCIGSELLRVKPIEYPRRRHRFWRVLSALPMELQMYLLEFIGLKTVPWPRNHAYYWALTFFRPLLSFVHFICDSLLSSLITFTYSRLGTLIAHAPKATLLRPRGRRFPGPGSAHHSR